MTRRPRITIAIGAASAALLLTACGGGGGEGSGGENEISVRGCTPQNPLIPAATNETCGGNVLDGLHAKLVRYDPETAEPSNDIAESIETEDNQTFTVKIKEGYKFSDGTDVLAHNFVDAWNFSASCKQGYQSGYFFEPIEGYADMAADEDDNCNPKTEEMSGLEVVDDHTFTIKTANPVSNLPMRLGYTAFAPLPDSFFDDPDAYAEMPVGSGPFKMVENNEQQMVLEKNPEYAGDNPGQVDKVTFKIYNDEAAAYNDVVANQLDFTEVVPTDQLVGDAWKASLPDRHGIAEAGVFQSLSFSPTDEQLADPKKRQALSMALDRELITQQVFNGSREPADGWVAPSVDGYEGGACGEYCEYDPEKAKKMWDEAGGYDGPLTLSVNGDGGHRQWAEAVCNNWRNDLGVDCQVVLTPDFKTLRNQITKREIKGIFRSGWQMDYPHIENFLTPLYKTDASSNDTEYSNPEFDKKIVEADSAKDPAEANKLYQEAEQMLPEEMTAIPQWYQTVPYAYSDRVDNVKVTPFQQLDLSSITVK